MKFERIILDSEADVTLDAYILDIDKNHRIEKRPSVIVCPGGSYKHLAFQEGEPAVMSYLNAGYNVFLLRYSVGVNYKKNKPLHDFELAYECILNHEEEWHIMNDKIAIMGFSAGGHLAAQISNLSKYKVQAAVLVYPCTLRETMDKYSIDAVDLIDKINEFTPPTFITLTSEDKMVPPKNSLLYALNLVEHGVLTELHMYNKGNHGFGIGKMTGMIKYSQSATNRIENWIDDSIGFLNEVFEIKINRI